MKASLLDDARRVLTLFAGFVIGMHLAVLLHEVGHALGFWFSGGTVSRIVMQAPLPAGHVEGHGPSDYAHLWVWGGVVFGSASTIAPLALAAILRPGSPSRFAGLMVAAFCLGHNGMYLFVGSLLPFADASSMVALGAPRGLLFALGLPLLIGFVLVLTAAVRMVGLPPERPLWRWLVVVELGLLTFPAVMVASMLFMPVPASVRWPTVAFVSCYALGFAIATARARARATSAAGGRGAERTQMRPAWSTPRALVLASIVLVAAEWIAFPAATG